MSDTQAATPAQDVLDKAVAEGGAYEVLHKRLLEQGQRLRQTAERLNASRLEEFGDSQMDVIGRVRIRTENNCIARDIVQVGDCLLFGYNVFIGLRKETGVADVFSLYRLVEGSEGYEAEPVPLGTAFRRAGLRQRLQRALHLLQEHPPAATGDPRRQAAGQLPDRRADHRHPRVPLVDLQRRQRSPLHRQPRRARHRLAGTVRLRMAAGYPRDGGGGPLPASEHPRHPVRRDHWRRPDHQGREQHRGRPGHLSRRGDGQDPVAGRRAG